MTTAHWFQASNPLLRHLPEFNSIDEIADALRFDPLEGLDIRSLSITERHELLIAEKQPLSPTSDSTRIAMTILGMQRASLRVRNPNLPSGRLLVQTGIDLGSAAFDFRSQLPAAGASLFIVKGITGTAKTVTVKHTLRLLGRQVIPHGEEVAALWMRAIQLSWLFVGMSHDGSRGGLLNSILLAVDTALGTAHSVDLPKKYRSVERLAGATIALLHSLFLGVLVIDEIQLFNLVASPHARLMHLFLLNLVNSGIPLILIGNPLGFSWLEEFSQNLSRTVERPPIFLHPCGALGDPSDDEWDIVFYGIRRYYLLDEPPGDEVECSAVLKRRSGGIARLALALWCAAQIDTLLDGRACIDSNDIESAFQSEGFSRVRPLCEGFANRDPILLLPWHGRDIPVDFYTNAWGRTAAKIDPAPAPDGDRPATPGSPKVKPKTPRSAAAKLKAAETRAARNDIARGELSRTLAPGDMRMEGLAQHALASLDELMKSINRKAQDGPGAAGTNGNK